jgi:CelD/BcsL family acetyltransferase involved in cellulose biosynthesis
MSDSGWILAEHRGPEGFAALKADWRRLCADTPNLSMWHSHEAYSVYLDCLCPAPDRFRCFTLSDGVRVRAILPIEERIDLSLAGRGRAGSMRVWGMPWCDGWWISDAIGPEDEARRALLPAVIARLREQPDRPALLVLGRTSSTSALWDGLSGMPPSQRFAFDDGGEFRIPTDMSAEAFMKRLSKNSRQAVRSSARKFEALDGAAYVRAATGDELAAAFEDFLDVEMSGWKGTHGSAMRQHPALQASFRTLLDRLAVDGHCEIHSLHAEGRCIASAFCVYTRGTCAVFKIGYDESYARLSPGRLCNHKIIESCCDDPAITIVSEVGSAPWVRHWAPDTNTVRKAYIVLRPWPGIPLLAALRLRFGPVRRVTRDYKRWKREHSDEAGRIRREAE